ncbi:hypothetical protein [Streptomyces sp. NPDC051162]
MTAPIAAVSTGRSATIPRTGRWYGPRVPLPPLSYDGLRDPSLPPLP